MIMGLPSTVRFDRIDMANVFDGGDTNRLAPSMWARLLGEGEHATMLIRFENWGKYRVMGRCVHAGNDICGVAMKNIMERTKVPPIRGPLGYLEPDSCLSDT